MSLSTSFESFALNTRRKYRSIISSQILAYVKMPTSMISHICNKNARNATNPRNWASFHVEPLSLSLALHRFIRLNLWTLFFVEWPVSKYRSVARFFDRMHPHCCSSCLQNKKVALQLQWKAQRRHELYFVQLNSDYICVFWSRQMDVWTAPSAISMEWSVPQISILKYMCERFTSLETGCNPRWG